MMLRITITAIFFEKDITEVVEELKRNEELRLELQKSLLRGRFTASSANLTEISS